MCLKTLHSVYYFCLDIIYFKSMLKCTFLFYKDRHTMSNMLSTELKLYGLCN